MLKRRRHEGTTVGTGSSGDPCIIGLNVDCDDEYSCISDLEWAHQNSSERTMQDSGDIVALDGVWDHDETSRTDSADDDPYRPERQALVGSSHDQESELSRTRPVVSYILALALVFLSFLLTHTKQAQIFWNCVRQSTIQKYIINLFGEAALKTTDNPYQLSTSKFRYQ